MDLSLGKLKTMLSPRPTTLTMTGSFLEPEIGFRVAHNYKTNEIKVTVIAARHLPVLFGFHKVDGYVIKVKLYPGKEKYETEFRSESWPSYNQEFTFKMENNTSRPTNSDNELNGAFVVLTAFAILEQQSPNNDKGDKKNDKQKNIVMQKINKVQLKSLFENITTSKQTNTIQHNNNYMTFDKRRNVGTVTYALDSRIFSKNIFNNWKTTHDIWRTLVNISEGLSPLNPKNEFKRGELEIGLLYSKSETGETCTYWLSLIKMRCNMQIMQKHEEFQGLLYIKLRILNEGEVISKGKTQRFKPSISHRFDSSSTKITASFSIGDLEQVSFQIILLIKTKLGQKEILGKIEINSRSGASYLEQWEKSLETPNTEIIRWQPLE